MKTIVVGNPSRQHSDQLALALQDTGSLGFYLHGSAARPDVAKRLAPERSKQAMRYRLILSLSARLVPFAWRDRVVHAIFRAFDLSLAKRLDSASHHTVIAYENSALATFRKAKAAGMITILDAASVHHHWQKRSGDEASLARRNGRKDAEIALADHLLTCSSLARESYLEAGVDPDRCHVAGFGVDLDAFAFSSAERVAGPARFLFVGTLSRDKGGDVLIQACKTLQANGVDFELTCVGEADPALAGQIAPYAHLAGKLAYDQLSGVYAKADCLVHPSRFDSFASVVAEALATGIPAIVSDRTGAREMIRDGETGWIMKSEDCAHLAQLMASFAADPSQRGAMAAACRAEAENWTWPAYRARVSKIVSEIIR